MNSKDMIYTRENLLSELVRVSKKLTKETVSRREFKIETGISERQIRKHFVSWNDFVQSAGLQPTDVSRIHDDILLEEMYRVFISQKGIIPAIRFDKECKYSYDVYRRRFGNKWNVILLKFLEWVKVNHHDFPYADDLLEQKQDRNAVQTKKDSISESVRSWPDTGKRAYGPILNFRGLQHAPINEQGVVFLFGMIANELGFIVESIANEYPDCVAKRRIRGGHFELVKIEFEYLSRNFRDHGHDARKCDLIVCWEHNWAECPIDVVVLREEISRLPSS